MILCKCLKYFFTYICIFLLLNLSPCDSIFQMLCRNASNSIYCLKNSSNFVRACFRLDLNQIRISQIPFQVLRCVTCDQFSFGNDQNIIADFTDFRQNMRTQDHRMFLRKLTDQFTDLYDLFWIKSDTWFIKNNDLWESKHCLCQSDSLTVSFRQIPDQTVFHFPDLHHLLYFIDRLFSFILSDSFQLRYKLQIFTNCHLHIQRW